MQDAKLCALIRQTWYEAAVRNLSDQERLAFYEVCFAYEFTGVEPTRKSCPYSSVLLMFDMVKLDLAKDAEKARKITERNRMNGSLGGRPANCNNKQPQVTNPTKPNETQGNPAVLIGLPLHNTTQHNTTISSSSSDFVFDGAFFEEHIWPALDPAKKFRSRHRACMAAWLEMADLKRQAVWRTLQEEEPTQDRNPLFFLQDFPDPAPHYLTGREMENAWRDGKSVVQVKVGDRYKVVTQSDAALFQLEIVRELAPKD